jgi:hypothetical protein
MRKKWPKWKRCKRWKKPKSTGRKWRIRALQKPISALSTAYATRLPNDIYASKSESNVPILTESLSTLPLVAMRLSF